MARNRPRLVCLGDVMLDIVVRPESAIEAGTDVAATIRFRVGGSAANTCRAFARLGGDALFVGTVGDDRLGGRLTGALRASGVTVHATTVRGGSPRLVALLERSGERSFLTDRAVADRLEPRVLKQGWFARRDALHLPAYSLLTAPLAESALAAARLFRGAGGGLVSVDLASRRPLLVAGTDLAMRQIASVQPDVVFATAGESAALVGRRGTKRLLDIAPVVVIKEGAEGSRVLWSDPVAEGVLEIDVATTRVAVDDTTGAGDAFDAGFLHSLISSGYRVTAPRTAAVFRRAALAGHRAATRLLTSPRPEFAL